MRQPSRKQEVTPSLPSRKVEVRRKTFVTLAGVQPEPLVIPTIPEDIRGDTIRRLELQIAKSAQEDRKIAEKNANVTRIDDPTSKVTRKELIDTFDSTQNVVLNTLARLFVGQASSLASVQSVQEVISNVIGDSVDLDLGRANKLVGMLSEVKFIQVLTETLELEPAVRSHLLNRYIDREWGPTTPAPVIVRTETNSSPTMPKRRGPATAERVPNGGADRPKPASRGNMSVGPFGALPRSSGR